MSFTAPTKEAIVKPKYDATYKFKSDDKQKQSLLKKIKRQQQVNLFQVITYQKLKRNG